SAEVRNPASGKRLTVGLEDHAGPLPEELQSAVNEAMERLPDKQRLALILFSVEGMPQKEVAEILECSVELVKWNVFQARQKLKEMLKAYL
ncbi:MAG: sigma-70 family RNA polymerase sigma factor, partial [Phycisphaerales bacterium]